MAGAEDTSFTTVSFKDLKGETREIATESEALSLVKLSRCEDCQFTLRTRCATLRMKSCRNVVLVLSADVSVMLEIYDSVDIDVRAHRGVTEVLLHGCDNAALATSPLAPYPKVKWTSSRTRASERMTFTHGALSLTTGVTAMHAQLMPNADTYGPDEYFRVYLLLPTLIGGRDEAVLECVSELGKQALKAREARFDQGVCSPVYESDLARAIRILDSFGRRGFDQPRYPAEIIAGKLHLGSFWNAQDVEHIKGLGVTHVVNVATIDVKMPDGAYGPNIAFTGLGGLKDKPGVNLALHFDKIFDVMNTTIESGGHVFIHCRSGVSRSVTFVLVYLMRALGLSLEDALTHVRSKRPIVLPIFDFLMQLLAYERQLLKARAAAAGAE